MKKGTVNIIAVLATLLLLSGCGTTTTHQLGDTGSRPILSAEDARTMISAEVRELEPVPVEQAVAYHPVDPSR